MLPQMKILEGWTNRSVCVSREALFKGVRTRFGLQNVDKCFENAHLPKSSFGMDKVYAPQKKILEVGTNRPERLFDALFNVS
jgi:hypothetical protein